MRNDPTYLAALKQQRENFIDKIEIGVETVIKMTDGTEKLYSEQLELVEFIAEIEIRSEKI